MKKIRLWTSRLLAGVMTLMCFVGNSTPLYSRAAENSTAITISETDSGNDVVHYVALGDSMTAGGSTYVSTISSHLKNKYGNCVTSNLAVDGWQSGDLLDALTNPANSRYSSMRKAIKNADVITLDIGSNDLLQPAMQVIANCFGCSDISKIGEVTAQWSNKFNTASGLQLYLYYVQALVIARNINYQLNYGSTILNSITQFEINYKKIVNEISALAPNAKVYVGNIYNPYVKAVNLYVGSYEVVNPEKVARTHILKMNKMIANNSKKFVIVDLYNTINNPKYIKGDVTNYDFDPHLNKAGHNAVAAKFIAAMG